MPAKCAALARPAHNGGREPTSARVCSRKSRAWLAAHPASVKCDGERDDLARPLLL